MGYAFDLVNGKFDRTEEVADDAILAANDAITELLAFLDGFVVPSTDDVEDVVFPEILPIDYSNRPSFTAQLEDFPTFDEDLPPVPVLKDVPESDISVPNIVEVTDPGVLSHSGGAYNSDIRVDLFAKILNDIRYGGTGLDPTIEADIYDRGRERQRVENEALYRDTEERFTATGFELPTGALASALNEVGFEISRKNDQLNREITISQAELEQKNIQFSVDQAVKIEAVLTDFYNNQENRLFEVSKAIAQSTIDVYNAITANQTLKVERYKIEAEVFKITVESVLKENEILIMQYDVRIKAFISAMELEIKNAQLQVEAFKTEAMAFEVETNAVGMYYDTLIKENSLLVQAFVAKIQKQIAIIEATKGGYVALKALQEKGLEGIMNVNAQLGASAMNAVNASASAGESYSYSTGTSEIHSYDETK